MSLHVGSFQILITTNEGDSTLGTPIPHAQYWNFDQTLGGCVTCKIN